MFRDVVLFGAGKIGIEAFNTIGADEIYCFIDNDEKKQNTKIMEKEVISLDEYKKRKLSKKIVICADINNIYSIQHQLAENEIKDYTTWKTQLFKNINLIYIDRKESNGNTWNEINADEKTINHVKNIVKHYSEKLPLFREIEIETINKCNGVCSFCPVNKNVDTRKIELMRSDVFYKIINELQKIDYSGRIALFSNNEPFLDERIIDFHRFTKNRLPNAIVHLFSNGTLLTVEKFKKIIPYLDELIIDNYNVEYKLIPNVVEIKKYIEETGDKEMQRKVKILVRTPNEILSSRGGEAPNKKKMNTYENCTCALPFCQMIIRPSGDVSLCCNDPLGRYTLGNVNDESLYDIWYGDRYQYIREQLIKGRKNLDKCSQCDTFMVL